MAVAAATGVLAFAFRYLSNPGFSNDHFVHLARAQQMVLGGWPVRDFVDPGLPLMYVVSALGLEIFGHSQWPDSLIAFGAIGVAAGVSVWLAWRGGAPLVCAVIAAVFQVMIGPRSYSYPKLLLYAVGIAACWRLIDRPTPSRAVVLGLVTATAFLFRHDHGLFIGVAAAIALLATPWPASLRLAPALLAGVLVLLAPWAIYVQSTEGLTPYFRSAIEFSRTEAKQTSLALPVFALSTAADDASHRQPDAPGGATSPFTIARTNAEAILFYLFIVMPLACLASLVRWTPPGGRAPVVLVCVLALLTDAAFLRDPLAARLSDVAMPQTLIAAWAMAWGFRARPSMPGLRIALAAATATTIVFAGVSVSAVGGPGELLERIGRLTPRALWGRTREVTGSLLAPYAPRFMPSAVSGHLVPLFEYLKACTRPLDRFMYVGFGPELYFYAERGFAAGQVVFLGDYYSSDEEQRLMVKRMVAERVPLVLVPADKTAEFERTFPILARYLYDRYQPLADIAIADDRQAHVLGFEGQWNENVRLWYNLLIIIQYTKVPFQGPFRML